MQDANPEPPVVPTPDPVLTVTAKLRELADARRAVAKAREAVSKAEAALQATPEYRALCTVQAAFDGADRNELNARLDASKWVLEAYRETKVKAPAPGAAIRISRRVIYQDADVMAWAVQEAPYLVVSVLDAEKLKKAALAGALSDAAPVQIMEIPQVTIASDLSTLYPEEANASS